MVNIAQYQRNVNQNYYEASPHTKSEWPSSKNLQTTHAGEEVEKRKPSNTAGGNVN